MPALRSLLICVIATVVSFSVVRAEVHLPSGFSLEVVAGPDVVREPLDLAFAPDGSAWVTGRAGDLWRVDPATRASHRVGGVDTDVSGDRGLHGIAFHPDFPRVPQVFLSYHATNHSPSQYRARVARFTVIGEGAAAALDPASETTLVEWVGDPAGQHIGGALLAHPKERLLYVSTGENNQNARLPQYCEDPSNKAQSLRDLRGKVLRIGLDGSVPTNNPFAATPDAQAAVFTVGHRQPWSLDLDAPTGFILLAENGGDLSDDYEEVNRIVPGANFGWPRVFGDSWSTRTRTNRVEGFVAPWFSYKRNTGASCTGAILYRAPRDGGGFPAKYHGSLFYSDFARKSVRSAPVDPVTGKPGESEAFLQGGAAGPVALRLGPDGALYLLTHGGATKPSPDDALVRIVWKP
ncbi:MAG: PQQ-dependent sugar dehydrogenase [Verrucomicrobiales bacterium]|nr:PQQ-dependent sugar dehydrogenase [Verrucomicrobiales bacterium]